MKQTHSDTSTRATSGEILANFTHTRCSKGADFRRPSGSWQLLRVLPASAWILLLLIGALVTPVSAVTEYNYGFTGEITNLTDDLNWFSDSIQVGMPVEGTFNFFDSGYRHGIYPPLFLESSYAFYPGPNSFGLPPRAVIMNTQIGNHLYPTGPGPTNPPYQIRVINNDNGVPEYPQGDTYKVDTLVSFPANFHDWTCDPTADPDCFFFPYVVAVLTLTDSSGAVFSNTDLPLVLPDLSEFDTAVGRLLILDLNGEVDYYAFAEFRINSLQAVPEPSALALLFPFFLLARSRIHSGLDRARRHP